MALIGFDAITVVGAGASLGAAIGAGLGTSSTAMQVDLDEAPKLELGSDPRQRPHLRIRSVVRRDLCEQLLDILDPDGIEECLLASHGGVRHVGMRGLGHCLSPDLDRLRVVGRTLTRPRRLS